MSNIEQILASIQNKYEDFDGSDYMNSLPMDKTELKGTVLDNMLHDIHAIFAANEGTPNKIDFIGMSSICDGGAVEAYFDVVWIENDEIKTFPISVQSAY